MRRACLASLDPRHALDICIRNIRVDGLASQPGFAPLATSTLFGCIALARLYVEGLKLYIVAQSISQRSPALDQLRQPFVEVSRGDLLWYQARRPEDLSPSDDGSC